MTMNLTEFRFDKLWWVPNQSYFWNGPQSAWRVYVDNDEEGTREDFPKPGTVDPLEKDELETGTSQ